MSLPDKNKIKLISILTVSLNFYGLHAEAVDSAANNLTPLQLAQNTYVKCVTDVTDVYKVSSEPAETIAEGALGKCDSQRASWFVALEGTQGYTFAAKTTLEESFIQNLKRFSISRVLDYRTSKISF